ncbi:MAG TPA: PQQ-binding-like beta-propeller repeat protein [Acidimicrobiales bacterium]|nr:PQQ-binding-like beta-propeller repeat protein [Acidimicrobiales bacterium]
MTRSRLLGVVVAAIASILTIVPSAVAAPPPCTGAPDSDEWPTFGRDLANSRRQDQAGDIAPGTTPTLQPVWSYTTGNDFAGTGDLNGTPIVSAGCVFLNTAAGDVIALDSSTGEQIWRTTIALDPGAAPGLGGIFVSSPAVHDGVVLALVSQLGAPYVIGLKAKDGKVLWRSEPIVTGAGYYTNATAVVTDDGLLLAGFSPAEGDPTGRGGITIFDARTGKLVKRVHAIPDDAFAQGYAGAGIWTAPAVDDDGYAYAGTGNPFSKKIEHDHTNAIIKIDVDPTRETFGTVVGSLKGLIEQYRQELRDAVDPTCEAFGEDPNLQLIVGDSAPCAQLDQDFGAPPTLFTDSSGTQLIGDLQKAGVFHVARTDTMARAWDQIVGVTCPACNAAAWAFDDEGRVVGASSPVGTMVALEADDGTHAWASPIVDGTHYQSTSLAGGVAFTVDNLGNLLAFDAATGIPLLRRPLQIDAPDGMAPGLTSSGVAIASGMVLAAAGNVVVAYAP